MRHPAAGPGDHGRQRRLALGLVLPLALAGCAVPAWMPLIGKSSPEPVAAIREPAGAPAAAVPAPAPPPPRPHPDEVIDRVIVIVNNDAITLYELDEAEAYYVHETKDRPRDDEARRELRERLLRRMIENRLQLQQAERDRITVEDAEVAEQLADVTRKLGVHTVQDLQATLTAQGITLDAARRRIREQLMVQKVVRRKVALRVSVTEQEIDRYLAQNRDKLETGLAYQASHILLIPQGAGDEAWATARQRAEALHAQLRAGADFAELARQHSDDGSGQDGGQLGTLKRGELAPEIEAAILALEPGEASAPFRSRVGYHLFKLASKESLTGEALAQARAQIRDILFREKYEGRLEAWLAEIRAQAVIDMRL
jgi:peptidyl-prolyl cis-trans isomerase SurA